MSFTQNRALPMQAAMPWRETLCFLTPVLATAARQHARKEIVSDSLGFRSEDIKPKEGRFT